MQGICETTVRVRYAETDQMGVVYHSNFFIWFEVGRVELLRQLGFSYREMEREDGCYIPVVDARCRFKSPARYDDVVVIRTRLTSLRGPFIHFAYEALRPADGSLYAEGETIHVITDRQMNIRSIPEKYREVFERAVAAPGLSG
jgi:acyl-CoA thioester hydrolase